MEKRVKLRREMEKEAKKVAKEDNKDQENEQRKKMVQTYKRKTGSDTLVKAAPKRGKVVDEETTTKAKKVNNKNGGTEFPDFTMPTRKDPSVKQVKREVFQHFLDLYKKHKRPDVIIWEDRSKMLWLSLRAMSDLLRGLDVDQTLIDVFIQISYKKYRLFRTLQQPSEREPEVYCFNGSCLNAVKSKDDDFFKQTIEQPLEEQKKSCRYLVFPLYHEPDNEKKKGVGHWTLMYADLQEVKYYWYNSMRPLPDETDDFIEDARVMKRIIHQLLFPTEETSSQPRFDLLTPTPEDQKDDPQFIEIVTAPQQPRPSYECGIYVMKWIHDMFFEKQVPSLAAGIHVGYRASIFCTIMQDEKTEKV